MLKERDCIAHIKPYIPGKPIKEVERELGNGNIIKMASNENPLGPSPNAVEAITRAASEVNIYPDANCYYLRNALANQLGVKTENIIIGNGSEQLIGYLTKIFLNPGDEVVMADPSFSMYTISTELMDGKAVHVPLDNRFCHDLDVILKQITAKTKIIFICNPNNPTGTVVLQKQMDQFIQKVPKDILIVLDEAYFEYVDENQKVDGINYVLDGMNVMVLRTFSKIYGLAGLRIGYGIAQDKIIESMSKIKEAFNVNSIAQEAALASLSDQGHVVESVSINNQGRDYLYNEFDKMGLKYALSQTNFVLVDIGLDSKKASQQIMEEGIIVRPGDIFGYPTSLRVSIGKPNDNEKFINVLKRLLHK